MHRRQATSIAIVLLIFGVARFAVSAEKPVGPAVDSVMEEDPSLAFPAPKVVFPKQLLPLWLRALDGPEADLRREVADMIARAHRIGMPGTKKSIGPLIKVLSADDQRSVVRLAVARTLVVLDAREAAKPFFELLDVEGLAFAQIVEPALAAWDYQPIRKRWLARLEDTRARPGPQRLAIRGLGQVRETAAAAPLSRLIQNRRTPSSLRIAAAKAMGRIHHSGLVDQARTLADDKTPRGIVDRLIAATLLAYHSDDSARQLLLKFAVDRQPTVAAIALKRLLEIDSSLVIPLTAKLLENPDANVRMLAAQALAAHPVQTSVEQLGTVMNDPHPDVRRFACRTLFTYGSIAKLKIPVRATATRILSQKAWRGQEQAALLMGALDHKPAVTRLVKLLDAPRGESRIAAAWALRKLAVPATAPAMLARAVRIAEQRKQRFDGRHDEQLTQLLQSFGQRKYKPATDVLWRLIPKSSPFSARERVSAIWALGHIDVGGRRRQLSGLLQGRLSDVNPFVPENNHVRAMSAVSLGRMKVADAAAKLRQFYDSESPQSEVGFACRWAIQNISGETLPGPVPKVIEPGRWSLSPLAPAKSKSLRRDEFRD